MQNTSQLLMIEPVNFGYNAETAVNNTFQNNSNTNVQQKALTEFNAFVTVLKKNKIEVTVVRDTVDPYTPDAIFPNNWISFHEDGSIFIYPMFALNRRKEKKENVFHAISEKFVVNKITDLSHFEERNIFLEGTGSMVLDRENRIAYACSSPRTDIAVFEAFCSNNDYTPLHFFAQDLKGVNIYHTNVMMCIADAYAVVCLEVISSQADKKKLVLSLQRTNKEIITISTAQLLHFAGNMLQVINIENERLLIMSTRAYSSLTEEQIISLEKYNRLVHSSLDTIENTGGGSARCMIAEIFLQMKLKG